ncbi:MAG: CHAT domain-containing protein, partial [bacterium]
SRLLLADLPSEHWSLDWLICPHGPLQAIPWLALPAIDGALLGERQGVTLVPYWSSLLRPMLPNRQLSYGEPFALAMRGSGDDLPAAQTEIDALTASSALQPVVTWHPGSGDSAARLTDALQHVQIWHFAGHGHFDPYDPSASYLQCGDERLTVARFLAGEFIGPELRLVTLAACESGRLATSSGHLVEGFTRALLATGTRAMLVGGWKVRDDVTAAFMRSFYQLISEDPAEALRETTIYVRHISPGNHPYFWAGFQLWGAPRLSFNRQ